MLSRRPARALHGLKSQAMMGPSTPAPSSTSTRRGSSWYWCLAFAAICLVAVISLGALVAITAYGGLVGRTWNWHHGMTPTRFLEYTLPRLLDSNLAGYEEDGWTSGVVYEAVRKTHGDQCAEALAQPGAADLEVCPCLAISRRATRPRRYGANDRQRRGIISGKGANLTGVPSKHAAFFSATQPFFFLKLHKVGSTTITNALMMQCVEQTIAERKSSLSSMWPSTKKHYDAFTSLSKLPEPGTENYDASQVRRAHARVLGHTPAIIDSCRRLPLRISHNSIRAYLDVGHCAAARGSISACVLQQAVGFSPLPSSFMPTLVVLRRPVDRFVSSM